MDLYEEAVLQYISSSKKRFLNPQFEIDYDKVSNTGGSLPDFVVLDFEVKTIYVVEVTTSYNVQKLLSKVAEAKSRWIEHLHKELSYLDTISDNWKFHITLFIRDDRIEYVKSNVKEFIYEGSAVGVSTISLKKVNEFLGEKPFEGNYPLENINS